MTLNDLRPFVKIVKEPSKITEILGISSNSKTVQSDFLFIAEKGQASDGHQYINNSILNGACGIIAEREIDIPENFKGFIALVSDCRKFSPIVASLFYNYPSRKLYGIGITGTNGKTSITYLLEHLFKCNNLPTGVIGTINHHFEQHVWETNLTTPSSIDLQERLNHFVEKGAKSFVMEVSSHALSQQRVENVDFDIGIFTNLTHDHLDYHKSMNDYFKSKEKLFSDLLANSSKKEVFAVINKDDPWGAQLKPSPRVKLIYYGTEGAEIHFKLHSMSFSGSEFSVHTPIGSTKVKSPLIGVHNIYNVLAAMSVGLIKGFNLEKMSEEIAKFKGIPGRLESVPNQKEFSVYIDYAHTPDALKNVLLSLQSIQKKNQNTGKIICVFGCGGDRDKTKRPIMAQIAQTYSDCVIVTSDNPRSENSLEIINDISSGFINLNPDQIYKIEDRAKAIETALNLATKGDAVLIAGKGHENYQIIGNKKNYFSDFEIARNFL